jgi:hypothetical protein
MIQTGASDELLAEGSLSAQSLQCGHVIPIKVRALDLRGCTVTLESMTQLSRGLTSNVSLHDRKVYFAWV